MLNNRVRKSSWTPVVNNRVEQPKHEQSYGSVSKVSLCTSNQVSEQSYFLVPKRVERSCWTLELNNRVEQSCWTPSRIWFWIAQQFWPLRPSQPCSIRGEIVRVVMPLLYASGPFSLQFARTPKRADTRGEFYLRAAMYLLLVYAYCMHACSIIVVVRSCDS